MNIQKKYLSEFLLVLFLPLLFLFVGSEVSFAIQDTPALPVASNSKTANTWGQFTTFIADETIDEIKLGNDLTATSSITATNFPARNLTINGGEEKYKINMGSNNIALNSTTTSKLLSVVNISFSGTGSGYIFNTTSANSNNWTMNMVSSNLNTAGNTARFINLPSGVVHFSGGTTIRNAGTASTLNVKKIFITDSFFYSATNAANTAFTAAPFVELSTLDGEVGIFNSNFTGQTTGTLFNSTSVGTTTIFTAENSTINVPRADNFYTGLGQTDVRFVNTPVSVGTISKNFFTTNRVNSPMDVSFANSPVTGTTIAGSLFTTTGATSSVAATMTDSSVKMSTSLGGGVNATVTSSNISSTFERSEIETPSLGNALIAGGKVNSHFRHSPVRIETSFSGHMFQVNLANSTGSSINFENSDVYTRLSTTSTFNVFKVSGQTTIIADNSDFDARIYSRFLDIATSAPETKLSVKNGSIWNVTSIASNVISAGSVTTSVKGIEVNVDGTGTILNLNSEMNTSSNSSGVIYLEGENTKLSSTNGATLNVKGISTSSPAAINLRGVGGGLYVSDNSTLVAETRGSGDIYAGTIRFGSSDMTFDVSNNSIIDIRKYGGSSEAAQAIRFQGENNVIRVRGGSDFKVYNQGRGTATTNMAIYYASVSYSAGPTNIFDIQDKDSNVSVIADRGPAIVSANNNFNGYTTEINAGADTYFVARGATTNQTEGIFSGVLLNINFDSMKYYDFTNARTNGGRLFTSTNANSKFKSSKSKLNVWRMATGVNIFGNPNKSFSSVDYQLSGANFTRFDSGTPEFQSYYTSSGGMNNFTRMNGDNQRAKLDEIRTPTNADKYIWAHVSIPEGKNEADRDAFTDEVILQVSVYNTNGSLDFTAEGKSIGNEANNGGISVYGETPKAGMVKILVPDNNFLKAGQKVVVDGLWRGEKKSENLSRAEDILVKEATTIDITPPTQPVIDTLITNAVKQIKGKGEDGSDVFVKVNGTWLKDSTDKLVTTTVVSGEWVLNLPKYLVHNDVVEVYLKDQTILDHLPTYELPRTYTKEPNNQHGNLNEALDTYASYVGYHDATSISKFSSSSKKIANDVLPTSPSLIKSVESSSGNVTTIGDTLTYTIKAGNPKSNVAPWSNVFITDVIPEEVTFDPSGADIEINGVTIPSNKFTYNNITRLLTISIGDVMENEEIVTTFKVTVNSASIGKQIINKSNAKGDSPQEDPFIPGPENENGPYKEITIESNSVNVPGGLVTGSLTLASAPMEINFGNLKYDARTQRVENPTIDKQLVVRDTRENRTGGWTLTATLSTALKNDDGKELVNALRYVSGDKETILDNNAHVIHVNSNNSIGDYSISNSWGGTKGTDGLKLHIDSSDKVYQGKYVGVITWKIMAGQP